MPRAKEVEPRTEIARAMLPSLGFFGGTWADCLDLRCSTRLRRLRIESVAPTSGFLNLRGVLARKDRRTLNLGDSEVEVVQSSDRPESRLQPQRLSKLTGIHSMRQVGAWWEAHLPSGADVDQIVIFNRADGLGDRSRELRVTIWGDGEEEDILFDSGTQSFLRQTVQDISRIAGGQFEDREINTIASAQRWRTNIVARLCDHIDRGGLFLTAGAWSAVAALLPTRPNNLPGGQLEGLDWKLLAFGLCSQLARDRRSRSGVHAYAKVLNTRSKLERLEAEFDSVTKSLDIAPIHHVRHGLDFRGKLSANSPSIARLVEVLKSDVLPFGATPVLAYGSLLGAVRDGKLLSHDDDFDVIVVLDAPSQKDFEIRRNELLGHLGSRGWNVSPNGNYFNAHLGRSGEPAIVDLFVAWDDGDFVWTHMEKMKWRTIQRDWFVNLNEVTVDGINIAGPKAAEEFLFARYGAGWVEPDKYYDWRWTLDG